MRNIVVDAGSMIAMFDRDDAHHAQASCAVRQPLPGASRSIRREKLLRRDKVGPSAIGLGRKRDELLIVALGLRAISDPLGGLCGTRKGTIAVWIVAQRRCEFLEGLRGFIRFEQQLAEQFPNRRETISIATCLPLRSSKSAA